MLISITDHAEPDADHAETRPQLPLPSTGFILFMGPSPPFLGIGWAETKGGWGGGRGGGEVQH